MITHQGKGLDFELKGRRSATTFAGFCSEHDRKLFKDIDYKKIDDVDLSSPRQALLHFFRATAMEFWKKRNGVAIADSISSRNKNFPRACKIMGLDPDQIEFNAEAIELQKYGQQLGMAEARQNYLTLRRLADERSLGDQIFFVARILPNIANFAVISGVSTTQDLFGSPLYDVGKVINQNLPMPHMGLAILPHRKGTAVMAAMLRRSRFRLKALFEQLKELKESDLEIPLSRLVMNNCENVVFKPSAAGALSPQERKD